MTDDIHAEGRAAREAAEQILDNLVEYVRGELDDIPREARFDLLTMTLMRRGLSPAVLAAGLVVAVERLLTREQLDDALEGFEAGGHAGGPDAA